MSKSIRLILVLAAVAAVIVIGALAQQQSADTAIDPVCGMTVVKANAKATYDYKGTTYYFCNPGCKDAFVKDPEKYLKAQQEKAGTPAPAGQMGHMGGQMGMMKHAQGQGQAAGQPGMCPMMEGGAAGQGMAGCPMMQQGGMGMMGKMGGGMMGPGPGQLLQLYGDRMDVTLENTKDGAALKFSSKDAEVVKAIQVHLAEHLQMMKKMKDAAGAKPATGGAVQKEAGLACCDNCPIKK